MNIELKHISKVVFLALFSLAGYFTLTAQEGGPPMLVDDAEVADYREWELNTSVNYNINNNHQLGLPHIDLNYGIWPDVQFTIGAPLEFTFQRPEVSTGMGEMNIGIKYLFLKEENFPISAGTFPQFFIDDGIGFFMPLFIQKTFDKLLLGYGISYFIEEKRYDNLQMGFITGYQLTDRLELMAEYLHQRNLNMWEGDIGYINAGFRFNFTDSIILMGSFGTQVVDKSSEAREKFISWLGIRSLF